jgi:glycosyl hydrolase family 30
VMIHVDGPCRVWVDDFRVMEVDAQGTARPIVRDGLPSQHQLYGQWIELYHGGGRPYLQHGVAIPPPTVEPTGAVEVGAFRAADGSEAVIAVNATDTTQQATLRWDGKSKRVELMPSEVKLLPQ